MSLFLHQRVELSRRGLSRRSFMHHVSGAAVAAGTLNFRDLISVQAEELRRQGRALILLWMPGGPSQFETFDPKPKTESGGPTEAISTSVAGIQIAQGWQHTAQAMHEIALIRSMFNREGEHQRASYQLHTGYIPSSSVRYPNLGCAIAQEIAPADLNLPVAVTIGPPQAQGAGFLGVDFDPFVVQNPGQLPQNVARGPDTARYDQRLDLLGRLEGDFATRGGAAAVERHKSLYAKAANLVRTPDLKAFDFADEPPDLRAKYGETQFGRGCLLARRLVEAGVTFVEVNSATNWDTHQDNFNVVARNAGIVDPAFAALVTDLKQRGMLDRTLVLWMGEFGRTPRINPNTGRDHYPRAFNIALAGAGVRGGQVIGETTPDGSAIKSAPVSVPDLFSSICKALQVNPARENLSPIGRPIKIVDGGTPVAALFG